MDIGRWILAALLALLCGCDNGDALEDIQARGKLVVVSRNGPTTFYQSKTGPAGFEHALAGLLAEDLGVELAMQPAFTLQDIFTRLRRREAHVAAAGLTLTAHRAALYPHSIPYDGLTTQVVYVAGRFRPRRVEDLEGMSIVALAGSSHADALATLRDTKLPALAWQEVEGADTMELLDMLDRGETQLALIDSSEFTVQQGLYPRLKVAFDLSPEQDMVWYLPPDTDNARLLQRINRLFERLQADGTMARLRELHFGHARTVSRVGSHRFIRMMRTALPPYRDLMEKVAAQYQMDWRLLAAIAYQESHWDPLATSPTGVRGMMMLTLPTATEMGVGNRLDAAQSLRGGARYYRDILRRLPADILEPDRTWFALAAYNIGMGHLEDARILTERQGGDPHLWRDVMERLPLLQKSAYYRTVRYGYARGLEAVTYVQNIRHYYSILRWQDIPGNNAKPPLRSDDYLPEVLREVRLRAL